MKTSTLVWATIVARQKIYTLAVFVVAACCVLPLPPLVYADVLDPHNPADVERHVRSSFADIPSMAAIAKCESGFRQFDDGSVLFDPSYSMIGVFQISSAHLPESIERGEDILTLDGNLSYARHLYELHGIDPWMSSFGCWGSIVKAGSSTANTPSQTSEATPAASTLGLSFGMTSSAVLRLQERLNQAGFVVASTGMGSPGQETTKFGSLTRDALRRFQCAKGIVCSGDESTSGYGMYDNRTEATLEALTSGTPTPAPTASSSSTAAQRAQVESQIAALVSQLDVLNQRLTELSK